MNELLILRHAKSDWNTGARSDFERPLSQRGQRDAPRVGRFLAAKGLVPDHVVSSPAERARQTVLAVCEQLGIGEEQVHWDDRIYHSSTASLMDVLCETPPTARRVLIAGHNPGFENLVRVLCGHAIPTPHDFKLMPTAALAQLEVPAPWSELDGGTAKLVGITRARSLGNL